MIRHELTADGSSTLYAPHYDALYHSHHGAMQESTHVFIEAGLKQVLKGKTRPKILEYGMGTGLNVLLTLTYAKQYGITIIYHTIEKHPLSMLDIEQLNYGELSTHEEWFRIIHSTPWGEEVELTDTFKLTKFHTDFNEFSAAENYDIIYYDAFAPTAQPELWTAEAMSTCYEQLANDGILVTFCAKGSFKRALKAVGFEVESLKGPPGKREMTRARKI